MKPMKKFLRDCKGAVTVMVTLLLIPAILISGTAVDLARIYAAKSTLQDANQLAANSTLASYDALLQDLYGLYGVMKNNDGKIDVDLEKYIDTAVYGVGQKQGVGTFQLFYGSDLKVEGVRPAFNQTLGRDAVIRRQIEEYTKYRAPSIVANLLMEKLDTFEKIKEDAKVIKKKLEVDEGVEELEKVYKRIYDRVQTVNKCAEDENSAIKTLGNGAKDIQEYFETLEELRKEYATKIEELARINERLRDTDDMDDEIYDALTKAEDTLEKELEDIEEDYGETCEDIQDACDTLKQDMDEEIEHLEKYYKELEKLQEDCKKAEEKKRELKDKIDQMESALDSGKCSDALDEGLRTTGGGDGKTVLERYKDLLKYNVEAMGSEMYEIDYEQLEKTIEERIKKAKLGPHELLSMGELNVESTYPIDGKESLSPIIDDPAEYKVDPGKRGKGFIPFNQISEESGKFYNELKVIYSKTEGNGADKDILDKTITKVFKYAQNKFKALILMPEGAKYLPGGKDLSNPAVSGTDFGSAGNWGKKGEGEAKLKGALDADFLGKLANSISDAGNKLLLVVYDTEMFSDISTPGEAEKDEGEYPKENMAGIPMSKEVNYYFQSELEYLYNGNLEDARSNLRSVTGMIFLVRFVFDYVASFTVRDVNTMVTQIESALSWTGPLAILAGELARLALSVGEAVMDTARLIDGEEVAIFKSNNTWKLSISGLANAAKQEVSDAAIKGALGTDDMGSDQGVTLKYKDYIRFFLLLVDGDILAIRTGKLIELNVTNYRHKVFANESKMGSVERFDLDKAVTDFSITTTADLRMLFLSMPFAQRGVNGVIPPRSLPITVTDYRGY